MEEIADCVAKAEQKHMEAQVSKGSGEGEEQMRDKDMKWYVWAALTASRGKA